MEETAITEETPKGAVRSGASAWPFLIYEAVWAGYSAVFVQQMLSLPEETATTDASVYPLLVAIGVALTCAGPFLALAVWLATPATEGTSRFARFVDAMVRAAIATLIGVVMWWGSMILVDFFRSGRVL